MVSFLSSDNAALTGGFSVTVSGVSFSGLTETTPTAAVGTSSCGTTSWASGTSVVCQLSPGDGIAVSAFATVLSVVGTRSSAFSYDGPKIRVAIMDENHVCECDT